MIEPEQTSRLSVLVRKNAGKRKLQQLAKQIADNTSLTVESIHFLPLEVSDSLRQRFITEYNKRRDDPTQTLTKTWNSEQEARTEIARIAPEFRLERMYVFFQCSDLVGALIMMSHPFFQNCIDLVKVDGDSIYGCTENANYGIIVDKHEESGLWKYEGIFWGGEWINIASRL